MPPVRPTRNIGTRRKSSRWQSWVVWARHESHAVYMDGRAHTRRTMEMESDERCDCNREGDSLSAPGSPVDGDVTCRLKSPLDDCCNLRPSFQSERVDILYIATKSCTHHVSATPGKTLTIK